MEQEIIAMEQRSEEWFKARKGRLTGSRIGAAMGLSPFMTRDELIREMVREHYGAPSEREESPAMAWGTSMEPVAKAALEDLIGMPIHECGFFTYGESLGASPDGIAADGAVVEIKSPYYAMMKKADFKPLEVQPHYMAQVQLEMMCADSDKAYFFQWAPHGHKLEIVARDSAWVGRILNDGAEFLLDLERAICAPDRHLAPLIATDASECALIAAERYRQACAALDSAKEQHEAARAALIAIAGDAEKAEIGGFMLTKVGKAGAISYAKAVKDLLPGADLEPYRGAASTSWMIKDKAQ
jgi:putative phage-type endonuclease